MGCPGLTLWMAWGPMGCHWVTLWIPLGAMGCHGLTLRMAWGPMGCHGLALRMAWGAVGRRGALWGRVPAVQEEAGGGRQGAVGAEERRVNAVPVGRGQRLRERPASTAPQRPIATHSDRIMTPQRPTATP